MGDLEKKSPAAVVEVHLKTAQHEREGGAYSEEDLDKVMFASMRYETLEMQKEDPTYRTLEQSWKELLRQ